MVEEILKGRFRMYLLNTTSISENTSKCITFVCSDGIVRGDISWLERNKAKVCGVLERSCDRCGEYVFLPGFSTVTVKHTEELLRTGHTVVGSLMERQQVLHLLVALGCSVISRMEALLDASQCCHCHKYNYTLDVVYCIVM